MRKLILVLAIVVNGAAWAGDFEDGNEAEKRGDYVNALKLYTTSAKEDKNPEAQYKVGFMYAPWYGVLRSNSVTLMQSDDDIVSQYNIDLVYRKTITGIKQNNSESLKWILLSAQQGNMYAQTKLGTIYEKGIAVKQDYEEALKWYLLSAKQGHSASQLFLGVMYEQGKKVPQDYTEAIKWYRLSANQDHPLAQLFLGVMYEQGKKVPQDYDEAAKWYRLSATAGVPLANLYLGKMYMNGVGVKKDYVRARILFEMSAYFGDVETIKMCKVLDDKMTSKQIKKAKDLAKLCLSNYKEECY